MRDKIDAALDRMAWLLGPEFVAECEKEIVAMSKRYTEADYDPFIGPAGSSKNPLPLPNAEDMDPLLFMNTLASCGHMMTAKWGYAMLPSGDRKQWTQFFLLHDANMSMDLGGGGYAVTYGGSRYINGKNYQTPIVRRFAICKHEKVDGPGANHSRGWHPGHCRLCGLDMTIDSGD